MRYKISDLAKLLDVSTNTVRRYEDMGYISAVRDENSGYRYYDDDGIFGVLNAKMHVKYGFSHEQIAKMQHFSLEQSIEAYKERMDEMDRQARRAARQALAEYAPADYRDMRLYIKEESGRKAAYTAAGERVGQVTSATAVQVKDGQSVTLRYALGRGGDLQAVVTVERAEEWDTDERG